MIKEFWTLVKMLFASKPDEIDKVVEYEMKHFPFKGYKAMSWCGYIIHRIGTSPVNEITVNHETIHLMQAKMCGTWWRYYLSYLWEWLKGNPFIYPASSAYYTNPYEAQAYANETDMEYCKNYIGDLGKYRIKDAKKLYRQLGKKGWKEYIKSL